MWNFGAFFKCKTRESQKVHDFNLVGKQAKVLEEINPITKKGKVMVGKNWWLAVAENQKEFIHEGEIVTIKRVNGYYLIVGK